MSHVTAISRTHHRCTAASALQAKMKLGLSGAIAKESGVLWQTSEDSLSCSGRGALHMSNGHGARCRVISPAAVAKTAAPPTARA